MLADEPRVHVKRMDVADPDNGAHSCLVAFNVLEHIEDDVAAFAAPTSCCAPAATS